MLQKPVDISEMEKMPALMKLNDPGLFGSDVSLLGEDVVHVLVFLSWEFILNDTVEASHPRKRRWDKLNDIIRRSKKVNDSGSIAFPNFSFPVIDSIMPATLYEPSSKPIPDDKFAMLDLYFPIISKAFGGTSVCNEGKRAYFIMPVLAIVCALFDGDVKILSEEAIEGKRVHGHGAFEFVIKRGNTRVCIMELKRDNLEQGIAQAYVGSEVLADLEELPVVHSIVTNTLQWVFSRSLDDKIERSATVMLACETKEGRQVPAPLAVKKIAAMIYAILSGDS